jgi:hypothetical protein
MINKFTKDFIDNDFPGYTVSTVLKESNFWKNKIIPFVQVDLNLNTLDTYNWCLANKNLFEQNYTQNYAARKQQDLGHSWFSQNHSENWTTVRLIYSTMQKENLVQSGEKSREIENDFAYNFNVDLINQLENFGFKIKSFQIMKLAAGGWVQPHIDPPLIDGHRMEYFWIPLHSLEPSVKIYPYGFLKPKLGSMYFFNNCSFVHCVINQESIDRYVAIGRIYVDKISSSLKQKIFQNYLNQWY